MIVFIGEKRSNRAKKMRVRWEDGRLAAKQLFDALGSCGINPQDCLFINWFERGTKKRIRALKEQGATLIGMGRVVQKALTEQKISHLSLVHPAARGSIRRKDNYAAHVQSVLHT